jgi:cytidylate kinase
VFPQAERKFYLDASPQERARRRVAQLRHRGEIVDYQEILSGIVSRDHRDASRSVGPLAVPKDAEVVDTTAMSQEQVIEHIVARVKSAAPDAAGSAGAAVPSSGGA